MSDEKLRAATIRLAHTKPELRPVLLPLLKKAGDGPPVERAFSDEELLQAAEEVVKRDPKKRFSAQSIKNFLAERENAQYVIVKGPPSLETRLQNLVTQRKIVTDRTRGFFLLPKKTTGVGVEFKSSGGGGFEVSLNGEWVGEIHIEDGDFIHGSSLQREKVYSIDLDVEGKDFTGRNAPPEFKKLTDAKNWVRKALL